MQIILADHAGFCVGVKRTLALVRDTARKYGRLYSLGPLINNPQEVARLKEQVIVIDSIEDIPPNRESDYLIIPSHGLSPTTIEQAEAKGMKIIDATCPLVKKAQMIASRFTEKGYLLIVVGDKHHPEVRGIVGWAGKNTVVIENTKEAEALLKQLAEQNKLDDKIALIAQTTQIRSNLDNIESLLRTKLKNLEVCDTICLATKQRQEAALALTKEVDVIFVIGGKKSSNTKKLAQLCSSSGIPAYLVETADEIIADNLHHAKKIGITAGASTPDWIIEEVFCKMLLFEEDQQVKQEDGQCTCQGENQAEQQIEVSQETVCDCQESTTAAEESLCVCQQVPATENEKEVSASPEDAYQLDDIKEIRRGARIQGVIVQIKPDHMLIDIGGKSEGILPLSELTRDDVENIEERFSVGDDINVLVLRKENQEGYPLLSKKKIDQEIHWENMMKAKQTGEIIKGKVTEIVKGGLLVDLGGLRGFVPASLVSLNYIENLSSYVGKELELKILECDRDTNKLLLSAKAVLLEKAKEQKNKTLATIEAGQTVRGVVRRLTNFGSFVDIGGVDGLLHVSEMAWYRVNHPSDILKQGDEIDVYILSVDKEKEKISLGLKQLIPNPWSLAAEKYPEGKIIQAKVMRLVPFGAFLQVEPGVEGLVHISQFAHERVAKPEDVLTPGDVVDVMVLSVDPENKRISLSIKATLPAPQKIQEAAPSEVVETAEENAPLQEDESVTIGDVLDAAKQD
ncbi:MAG: bifunctional 4-hydroxy-3-methylbut-2-enyl diphosphate reductase/30S ribosomal protein S1 [Bacillota bacterium]